MNRKAPILLFVLFFHLTAAAQTAVDSLTTLLTLPGLTDTAKVDVLNKLAWELKHKTPTEALQYATEAITLAREMGYKKGEGEALNQAGICFTIMGDYPRGLEYFHTALPVLEAAGEEQLQANTLNNIGNSHQLRGNTVEARLFFHRALALRTKLADTTSLYGSFNSLALFFRQQHLYDSAIHYFHAYKRLAEMQDDLQKISVVSNNLGLLYRNRGVYDSALQFFRRALEIKQRLGDDQGTALSYRNIGDVHNDKGDYGEALEYYNKSLTIREAIGYNFGLTILLRDMAEMQRKSGRKREALTYAARSLAVAREYNLKPEEADALKTLSAVYEDLGEYSRSLKIHQQYVGLKDSLLNAEKARQLNELQVRYETEQKEKELLAKSKAIELLEVQAAGDKRVRVSLMIAFLFMAGMAVVLYKRYRLKRRAQEELAKKNQEIANKNREIEEVNKELEKRMLRAQMDPHFIFNCLNGIQHFITSNDKHNALRYLSRFSKLVRQVLENSVNTIVPLSDELRLLELYIELEALRFGQRFEHEIAIDPDLDVHNVEVPFLLLQPYVENAIQHGLRHRPSGGRLSIKLERAGGNVCCVVEDNGVGRSQARRLNGATSGDHRPRGMALAEQRLTLLNKKQSRKTLVRVEDLNESTRSCGTKVTITIPDQYDE
ncbi:MAG TPA: tetratricopeptide repeat protein [Cyclobacteriaceae bacterium]|nr:tetratricopeptide repeat protein [Cyclobacteriaceae bacterium]